MTVPATKAHNVAQVVWEAARSLPGWHATDEITLAVRKVIPWYEVKKCADVLRNLKQRDLIMHKAATPGNNQSGKRGCSRWLVHPCTPVPEWRLAGGKRAHKNKGTRIRESDRARPGAGKIALEEVWPYRIAVPKAKTAPRVHLGLMADD